MKQDISINKTDIQNLPLVSVILVNWNGKEDTIECLNSLTGSDYPYFEVIVVDNGSNDNSPQIIKENFPKVILLAQKNNVGFAEGNNIGMRAASGQYFFLLNSDTVVEKTTISELVKVMVNDGTVGSCAPKVLFYHRHDIIECAGGCVDNVGFCYARPMAPQIDRGQFSKQEEVFMASAGFMLLNRTVVDKEGFFDSSLFFGYEELEMAFKVRESGYKAMFVPTSRLFHKRHRSYSSDFTVQPTPFKMYRNTRNRIKLVVKYFPFSMLVKNSPLILLSIIYWNIWLLRKGGVNLFAKASFNQFWFSIKGLQERLKRKGNPEYWRIFVENHGLKDYYSFYKHGKAFFDGDLFQNKE